MAYQGPKGTQDLFGEEIRQWQEVEKRARKWCDRYDVHEIRTPVFEHTEVFKRENDSSDVVNKEMYTFMDYGHRSLTLRPEGTAGVIRALVQHKLYADPDLPIKLFYIGPNFRYENPQKGRTRIHHQFGVEWIGLKEALVDVAVIELGLKVIADLGLRQYKLHINSLGDEETRGRYRMALQDHFRPVLGELCADCQRRYQQNPMRILDCKIDHDHPAVVSAPLILDYLSSEAQTYFDAVQAGLQAAGIAFEVDAHIVRGLDYYTHTVFEVISTNPKMGAQATLFAGGRYDKLVSTFGGPDMSSMGFGMGIERILVACSEEDALILPVESLDIYGMPLSDEAQYVMLKVLGSLRDLNYRCDMDYGHRAMKGQFKSADRKRAKVLMIMGEDELRDHRVTLKNTANKEQVTIDLDEVVSYLKQWSVQE